MQPPPIPILLYHRVDESGAPFTTPPELFEQHLTWLADRGYTALTASELHHLLAHPGAARPRQPVALTFDDGYADLVTRVAPALDRHGLRGTAFLITSRLDQRDPAHLSWDQARTLAGDGTIELQTHTHSHERWPLGSASAGAVADDVDRSISLLSDQLRCGRDRVSHLAWPWGRTCGAWEQAVARLGVSSQFVVQRGAADRPGRVHRLPRLGMDGSPVIRLGRWLDLLSDRRGARTANLVYGTVRQIRRGAGYR
jgi:hypothetical protein